MDKQSSSIGQGNSNTWSNRASRKFDGVKPPVPPKPPRKPLANQNQFSDPSYPNNQRSYYHPHYLTLSHSRKAPSFDYLIDANSQLDQFSFKRASSIDGSCSDDLSRYSSNRLSTFIGNENKSELSSATTNTVSSTLPKSLVLNNIKLFSQTANRSFTSFGDNLKNNKTVAANRANTLGRSNSLANSFTSTQPINPSSSANDDNNFRERNRSSLPTSAIKPVNRAILNKRLRSKSEHHPRCPNRNLVFEKVQDFDQMSQQATSHDLKSTHSATHLDQKSLDPPSSEEALQGIKSVIEPMYQISDACNNFELYLHQNFLNGSSKSSSPSQLILTKYSTDSDSSMSFKSCNSDSPSSSSEYLNNKPNDHKDAQTSTDNCFVVIDKENGEKVFVKLRKPMPMMKYEDKSVLTDESINQIDPDSNLFEGLKRGSKGSRKSEIIHDGRLSLRKSKTLGKNTLERRRKTRSLNVNKKKNLSHETASLDRKSRTLESDMTDHSDLEKSLHSRLSFDENKEWEKVAEIVASFGNNFLKPSDEWDVSTSFFSTKISVDEWLNDLSLQSYVGLLVANGYDDVEFMNVMTESDLLEIGISNNDDRKRLLDAAAKLPGIKKLSDKDNQSLFDWLSSLKLDQYAPVFMEKGFDDMNKVRNIWDVELTVVLQVNKLGHKRRILASIPPEPSLVDDLTLSFDKLDFNIDELHNIDFHNLPESKTQSKFDISSSSRPSDIEYDQMSLTSDQRNEINELSGSMHSSITSAVAISNQWRHDPLELYQNGFEYKANYLGSTLVSEVEGIKSTRESILKLKNSTKGIKKIPIVTLKISHTGVKFIDRQTNKLVCEHEIRNIHCACQDADDFIHFAYITKEHETNNDFCHVFCAENVEMATEIILTLGQAFDIAYRLALGEDISMLRESFIDGQK